MGVSNHYESIKTTRHLIAKMLPDVGETVEGGERGENGEVGETGEGGQNGEIGENGEGT